MKRELFREDMAFSASSVLTNVTNAKCMVSPLFDLQTWMFSISPQGEKNRSSSSRPQKYDKFPTNIFMA
jgi:hypothetical protein